MKQMSLMMCAVVCTLLAGCGGKEPLQGEPQTELGAEQNTQVQEETKGTELTGKSEADDLLDKFFAGELDAEGNDLYYQDTFNVSDLPIDVEDWQSYSVGERLDLDNDGENEQILYGPYGGMYLDATDGKVKVFACGEGTAMSLSYTLCDEEAWIVYSDVTHAGRMCYFLEKRSGADNVVESTSLEMYYDEEGATYYVDGGEVSKSVYKEEYLKYFGVENYFDYDKWLEEIQAEEAANRNDLYETFLKNEISVANPYVEGDVLSVMSDEDYDGEFNGAEKKYAFVDVNMDDEEELVFKISAYPSELMMILGVYNDELICFDVMETHTSSMSFGVYDYGMVWWGQSYDGFERKFYTYTEDGRPELVRTFTKEDDADMAAHEGGELEWHDWENFSGL